MCCVNSIYIFAHCTIIPDSANLSCDVVFVLTDLFSVLSHVIKILQGQFAGYCSRTSISDLLQNNMCFQRICISFDDRIKINSSNVCMIWGNTFKNQFLLLWQGESQNWECTLYMRAKFDSKPFSYDRRFQNLHISLAFVLDNKMFSCS